MADCELEDKKLRGTHAPASIQITTVKGIVTVCARCALLIAGGSGIFAALRATQQ